MARYTLYMALSLILAFASTHSVAANGLLNGSATTGRKCPPAGFDSVAGFDLAAYTAAPWFVQKQAPVAYQQPGSLFCVRAQYTLINPKNLKEGVIVNNYSNRDRVNGPAQGTSGSGESMGTLVAVPDPRRTGPTAASKLRVGPQQLQRLPQAVWYPAFGPYWVVAVGPSANKTLGYDWAIVTGGSPTLSGPEGCRAGRPDGYFGGLWLFSRKPVDPENTKVMLEKAKSLGLDTTTLKDVQQQGCTYKGA